MAIVLGALISAVAFTAGSAAYDQYRSIDVNKRTAAQDKLRADELKYNRDKQAALEYVNSELKLHQDAMSNFNDIDAALERYNELFPEKKLDFPKAPKLSDYYTPSDEKIHMEYGLMIAGGALAGYIVYKYI